MSRVIAGIYEIDKRIGAGGGGIVYLGRHIRLKKQVVLKADKRTLRTKPEVLRREVDMLKNLSHTYIPQVYDFVQEDGVVYTVMDFIEGESFDKILARGDKLTQPQIIKWSCQLLEALSYLHSRPPHGILHGDIKPANIMLRPGGDICLIDYNIALALGENGAVKAGLSRGYASPEHYGLDYSSHNRPAASMQNLKTPAADAENTERGTEATQTLRTDLRHGSSETESLPSSGGSGTSGPYAVMLNVRSDIYSLGATLYHLISGHRPAQDAGQVEPLGEDVCSLEISEILQKAMAPDPAMRYQSADEMLQAFRQLHKYDKRTVRHKNRIVVSSVLFATLFLTGCVCSFIGLKQMEQRQESLVLAEYSAGALARGDVTGAISLALQALPDGKSILEAPVTAQAQRALTDALGVYDLSDGFKAHDVVELPSSPFKLAVSPEGSRFAVTYAYEAAIYDIESCGRIAVLPICMSALADVVFVDESHLVYAGDSGVTYYDLDNQKVLWTGENATTLALSGDGSTVAAVDRDDSRAGVYRIADGIKTADCSFDSRHLSVAANDIFADPMDDIFTLNQDGSRLAVSFSDGGLSIYDLNDSQNNIVIYENSDFERFTGGFCGEKFAFTAGKGGESILGIVDISDGVLQEGYRSGNPLLLQADGNGISLSDGNLLVELNPETFVETELAYAKNADITGFSVGNEYVVTATDDNCFSFYDKGAHLLSSESCEENCDFVMMMDKYAVIGNRNEPTVRILKLKSHGEAQLLAYDARYQHDEARISQDGKTVMLFHYQGFQIYDRNGRLLAQIKLPDAEYIYDQQFVKGEKNSWLEVTWYDGTVRCYNAADGVLLSEIQDEKPKEDLYEEFYTDRYRIVSPLHDVPKAYERKSDRLTAVLEEDAYLTYVTQVDEYIITEYINAAGDRYGLLMDENFQILARLPGLCDIVDGKAIFDYGTGNLRQCRLYSLQELIALGEK